MTTAVQERPVEKVPPDAWQVFITDRAGYVLGSQEALDHVEGHRDDDAWCEECPAELSLRRRSALPQPYRGDELRTPTSYLSDDLLMEWDRLDSYGYDDMLAHVAAARSLAAQLTAGAR